MTSSDSGTESNSLYGKKPESMNKPTEPDQAEAEAWEHSILGLSQSAAAGGGER